MEPKITTTVMINFLKYTLSLSFTGTDIKQELHMLKQHMIKEFKQKGKKLYTIQRSLNSFVVRQEPHPYLPIY